MHPFNDFRPRYDFFGNCIIVASICTYFSLYFSVATWNVIWCLQLFPIQWLKDTWGFVLRTIPTINFLDSNYPKSTSYYNEVALSFVQFNMKELF